MLPESLRKNLKRFEKRLFFTESTVFVCGGLLGVLLSFVFLFVSDRFWDTPVFLRFIITVGGCLVFGLAAVWWSKSWLIKRRDDRVLARIVQSGIGGIGDRLLGAVELAEGGNLPDNVSPALREAAIKQVAEQMKAIDFRQAVRPRKSRYLALGMILCAAVVVAIALTVPSAFRNSLARWGRPVGDVPRYTFVSIEHLPDRMVVPHGEAFRINVRLAESSLWRPQSAVCRIEGQSEVLAKIKGRSAEFDLPGQIVEADLVMKIGDVKRTVRILPVFRPELVEMRAFIKLPDYLGYPDVEKKVDAGVCEALAGSRISLAGTVSRELQEAYQRKDDILDQLTIESSIFRTAFAESASEKNYVFTWRDKFGLEARQPYMVRILETADQSPVVECRGIARSIAILEDEILQIEAVADDDYGVKDLRLKWSVTPQVANPAESDVPVAEGGYQIKSLDGIYKFSPMANNIPEESIVTLVAVARDYRPGAAPALSPAHRIYVLSRASHAKLLQNLMERVQGRIEDLLHDELSLMKDNEALLEMGEQGLKSAEAAEQVRKNEFREREQARKLEDIKRQMQDLMKEMMRNSEIDAGVVKNWAEMMENLGDLSQAEMKEAVGAMSKASAGEQSEREQNLKDAVEAEKKIIDKLKESAGEMGKTIEDMLARNFINRLRELAKIQTEVGSAAKVILPRSIGLSRNDLPNDVEKLIKEQEERQGRISSEAGYVSDDLGGYYNRTRRAIYDTIRKDMAAKKMIEGLESIKGRIAVNLGVAVIEESLVWGAQFKEWADMLGEDCGEKDSESGEQEEMSEQDLEVLIELIRIRHGEESLREQTRMLEARRQGNAGYAADARKLAIKQRELNQAVLKLQRKVKNKKVKTLLEKIDGEMMNAEVYLKRPQTDSDTVAIQTEIIELLSGAMSECSGGKPCGVSMMLMQMMGMGKAGGGSNAGGSTDQQNMSFNQHDPSAHSYESRERETLGGVDEQWSEEFRELIEAYHKALEN